MYASYSLSVLTPPPCLAQTRGCPVTRGKDPALPINSGGTHSATEPLQLCPQPSPFVFQSQDMLVHLPALQKLVSLDETRAKRAPENKKVHLFQATSGMGEEKVERLPAPKHAESRKAAVLVLLYLCIVLSRAKCRGQHPKSMTRAQLRDGP